ncbi:MAG: excisionase, partial [Acetobacteraceae bacterium]|nr:excisionase [Acetobacteraceae bacterium]
AREPAELVIEAGGLLRTVAACLLGGHPSARPIHKQIASRWRLNRERTDLVRAVLVLLADHELNASTFAVRVVASTGAPLAACISTGLAALSGPLHGGATALAVALLDEAEQAGDPDSVIASRLRGGGAIPGFGHPLYPDGDPRAEFILDRLPADPIRTGLIAAVAAVADQKPNVDFALASLSRSYALPQQSGLVMFAAARTAGWIGHAIEQRSEARLIRPRAVYVGVPPG